MDLFSKNENENVQNRGRKTDSRIQLNFINIPYSYLSIFLKYSSQAYLYYIILKQIKKEIDTNCMDLLFEITFAKKLYPSLFIVYHRQWLSKNIPIFHQYLFPNIASTPKRKEKIIRNPKFLPQFQISNFIWASFAATD